MKIALTGMSSTGKSTTSEYLEKIGCLDKFNLRRLNYTMRSRLKLRVTALSYDEQLCFQNECFAEKCKIESKALNFIADRSFIDLLAYRRQYLEESDIGDEESYISLAKGYDHHFYFPHGIIPYDDDGLRPEEDVSIAVSNKILSILIENGIDYTVIDSPSLDGRHQTIESILTRLYNTV